MQHDYEWAEIAGMALTILERDTEVRTAPYTYGTRHSICIGQYTAKPHPALPVIANIDAARVFPASLTFEVGDGTGGKYPLCGSLQPRKVRGVAERESPTLGMEAVAEWLPSIVPGSRERSGMLRANGSSGTNGAAWKRSVANGRNAVRERVAPNTRLQLTARVDCGMNLSSARRSLSAFR